MTDQEKIAQFMQSRGATKVAAGINNNISSRDWYNASRNAEKAQPRDSFGRTEQDLINERHFVADSDGVEYVRNGLGEWL